MYIDNRRNDIVDFLNKMDIPYIDDNLENIENIISDKRIITISGVQVGIVELGCLCNAGLYYADIPKLIMALEKSY